MRIWEIWIKKLRPRPGFEIASHFVGKTLVGFSMLCHSTTKDVILNKTAYCEVYMYVRIANKLIWFNYLPTDFKVSRTLHLSAEPDERYVSETLKSVKRYDIWTPTVYWYFHSFHHFKLSSPWNTLNYCNVSYFDRC